MTFEEFARINRERVVRWHPGFPAEDGWSGADWSNAMCGEAGELANVVKKLRRVDVGMPGKNDPDRRVLLDQLGVEAADVFIYLDLLCQFYGVSLKEALVGKFNSVSEREGWQERLPE